VTAPPLAARRDSARRAALAHSVHAERAGLAPARWCFDRFGALGQPSPLGRSRTAPAAAAAATLRWQRCAWRSPAARATASATRPGATPRRAELDPVVFLGDCIDPESGVTTAARLVVDARAAGAERGLAAAAPPARR
jgi:alkaline phosphatase D